MSSGLAADARARLERILQKGLAAGPPDPGDAAVIAQAVHGNGAAPGSPAAMTAGDAAALLLALGRAESAGLEPPRMPPEEDTTSTLERLDAALRPTMTDGADRPGRRAEARAHPAQEAERRAERMTSPDDLLRLATGGTLFERRAATGRLEEFLRGDGRGFAGGDRKAIVEALELSREGAMGREIDDVLAAMPGAPGGRARTRLARAQKIIERFDRDVQRFWDGDLPGDPTLALDDETTSALGTYISDAPDSVAGHVAETLRRLVVEGQAEPLERVVSALALGADERLVPALVRVVQDGSLGARIHAAWALAPIDDPRVPAALRKALRHAATEDEKVVIGGVLAAHGDRAGAAMVVDRVSADHPPHVVELALGAMVTVGEPPHTARVLPFLSSGRASLARAAVVALGAFGDAAAVEPLTAAGARAELRPYVESALARIHARLVLAGQHGSAVSAALAPLLPGDAAVRPRTRLAARALGRISFAIGLLWLMLGRRRAALRRFDLAHDYHPYLVGPLLRRALIMLRERQIDSAVSALRAALRVRASAVLQLPDRANFVIRVYLRHADACAASGQPRRALEALDELLGYDLRFADVDLRLDAERRRQFVERSVRGEG